jgi:hypothetical protein
MQFWAGGHSTFGLMINCFMRCVVYTYYFLAALGPQVSDGIFKSFPNGVWDRMVFFTLEK